MEYGRKAYRLHRNRQGAGNRSMSDSGAVSIRILDKEYRVSCPPEEQEALMLTASYLFGQKRKLSGYGSGSGL